MTLSKIRRQGEVPEYEAIAFNLLPWARHDRYRDFFRWDLPAPELKPRPTLTPCRFGQVI